MSPSVRFGFIEKYSSKHYVQIQTLGRAGGKGDEMRGELAHLNDLIAQGRENIWYNEAAWQNMRAQVLKLDHYECQLCKAKGRHRRAVIVHHVKHLKDRPDLALSIWDGKERQLVSVCRACHEELHPERALVPRAGKKPVTKERWD